MPPRRGTSGWPVITRSGAETPGQWVGSGMAGIDGLAAGDVVTAEQMQALFGPWSKGGSGPSAQPLSQATCQRALDAADIANCFGSPDTSVDGF